MSLSSGYWAYMHVRGIFGLGGMCTDLSTKGMQGGEAINQCRPSLLQSSLSLAANETTFLHLPFLSQLFF